LGNVFDKQHFAENVEKNKNSNNTV